MMRSYELTDDEFVTLMDALTHSENAAVHSESEVRFRQARTELREQHEHQDPYSAIECERHTDIQEDSNGGGDDE